MSKRQLNIIYFVDSSKTRTVKIPLGRVSVVLLLLSAVGLWSIGSAFLLTAANADRAGLTRKLSASLATVFDYETRYDGVYDVAYPSGKTNVPSPPLQARPVAAAPAPSVASALAKLPANEPSATAAEADAAAGTDGLAEHPGPPAKALAAKALPRARETAETAEPKAAKLGKAENVPEKSDKPAKASIGAKGTPVIVGNPVIENGANALQVKFDLTNKSSGRTEGYIWAVASFKNDKGETIYIADPPNVGVKADGDVADVLKSSNFGIRKFKKMSFTFPVNKELNGTFTGIKIGVTDKAGANRTTYNVPVEIKVGKTDVVPEATNR